LGIGKGAGGSLRSMASFVRGGTFKDWSREKMKPRVGWSSWGGDCSDNELAGNWAGVEHLGPTLPEKTTKGAVLSWLTGKIIKHDNVGESDINI